MPPHLWHGLLAVYSSLVLNFFITVSLVHQSGELEDLLEKESILPPLEATEGAAAPAS